MVYKVVMIRTQVYLPKTDIDFLKELARINKSTMSSELRKAIKTIKSTPANQKENYAQKLLKIKGGWFKPGEWETIKKEFDETLTKFE